MAMEKKMFAERAKAAANQVDPVVLAEPVYATAPPGGASKPSPRASRPKPNLKARRKPGRKPSKSPSTPSQTSKPKGTKGGVTEAPISKTTQALWRDPPETTPTEPVVTTTQAQWAPTTEVFYPSSQAPWRPQRRRGSWRGRPQRRQNRWQQPQTRTRTLGKLCVMSARGSIV